MKLFPNRLTTIKVYSSPDWARGDQEKLNEAGIPNYLGWDGLFERIELRVPEEEAQTSIEILGITERSSLDTPQADEAIRCPQCQSLDVEPLPPYILLPGLLVCAVVGVFANRGEMAYGSIAVIVGALFLFWLTPRIPKWRCSICGNKWRGAPRPPFSRWRSG